VPALHVLERQAAVAEAFDQPLVVDDLLDDRVDERQFRIQRGLHPGQFNPGKRPRPMARR
jgi:hypothetical protein